MMTPLDIRIELLKHKVSMRSIARKRGVTPNAVWLVIHRRMVSRPTMEAVAEAIGKDKEEVFPWYFNKTEEQASCS